MAGKRDKDFVLAVKTLVNISKVLKNQRQLEILQIIIKHPQCSANEIKQYFDESNDDKIPVDTLYYYLKIFVGTNLIEKNKSERTINLCGKSESRDGRIPMEYIPTDLCERIIEFGKDIRKIKKESMLREFDDLV